MQVFSCGFSYLSVRMDVLKALHTLTGVFNFFDETSAQVEGGRAMLGIM